MGKYNKTRNHDLQRKLELMQKKYMDMAEEVAKLRKDKKDLLKTIVAQNKTILRLKEEMEEITSG